MPRMYFTFSSKDEHKDCYETYDMGLLWCIAFAFLLWPDLLPLQLFHLPPRACRPACSNLQTCRSADLQTQLVNLHALTWTWPHLTSHLAGTWPDLTPHLTCTWPHLYLDLEPPFLPWQVARYKLVSSNPEVWLDTQLDEVRVEGLRQIAVPTSG